MMRTILIGVAGLVAMSAPAAAQEPIPACQGQQQLEQVVGSNGEIMPEGCREVTISVLESGGERLCLVDLSGAGAGIVGQIQEAAVDRQWWLRCQDIEAALR